MECVQNFWWVGSVVDERHGGFEDAGFFGSDGLESVAEERLVIQTDLRDGGDEGFCSDDAF